MQVLGDLIRLPEDGSLPLPWWQRAPLGFLHGTTLHVGIAESDRPVGDIVVSTLDIKKWDNILRVDCTHKDERGVLAKLMEAVLPLNIALAETVTTENGKEHHATLFCESQGAQQVKNAIPLIKETLQKGGFREYNLDPSLSPTPLLLRKKWTAIINHGWLPDPGCIDWIKNNYDDSKRSLVDLTQAVVSADTENRLLRFVFPYRGTKTVKITHADQPGALRQIFQQFAASDLNILSALLRRGGQQPGHAELIAVSEPRPAQNPLEVYPALRGRIQGMVPQFDAVLRIKDQATEAEDVIYLPRPRVKAKQNEMRVVVSAPLDTGEAAWVEKLNDHVRAILQKSGCSLEPPPATPSAAISNASADRVARTCSRIEDADACIFWVTRFEKPGVPEHGDLLFELGYAGALSRPVLLLAESNRPALLTDWLPGKHVTFAHFAAGDDAFAADHAASLESVVTGWLREVRRAPGADGS